MPKITRNCEACGIEFSRWPSYMRGGMGRFCSNSCAKKGNQYAKGMNPNKTSFKKGDNLGNKNAAVNFGMRNCNWKGDAAGYRSLHKWVIRWLGKPNECHHCGKTGLNGREIHWANKDHKYRRVASDWIRLCKECHGKYDANLGLRKHKNSLETVCQ